MKKPKAKKPEARKGKVVRILDKRVPENKLKAALRDVVKKRGLAGTLILDRKMSTKEERMSMYDDDYKYANVYKYAFF